MIACEKLSLSGLDDESFADDLVYLARGHVDMSEFRTQLFESPDLTLDKSIVVTLHVYAVVAEVDEEPEYRFPVSSDDPSAFPATVAFEGSTWVARKIHDSKDCP